jgi:putative transposase
MTKRSPFRYFKTSPEIIRFWWKMFGSIFAAEISKDRINRMRSYSNWQWHLDEIFVKINGETHYLWRAMDHEGEVLESFVTKRRDRRAALKFLKKTMKRCGNLEVIVTDRLKSYGAAMKMIGSARRQTTRRRLSNRAENSHLPFRRRERAMLGFRQSRSLQKFVSIQASVHNHFNHERHLNSPTTFKLKRTA